MFHQSSKQILLGIFVVLLLITMPVYAIKNYNYKISNYGDAHQIWFEAEDYDERNPDTDQYYPVVDVADAFGKAINRAGGAGGMIRWTFDIRAADGKGGTWYFWARVLNPENQSDYMLVEGDPDDAEIPTAPPFPGSDGTPPFDNDDDRIFERTDDTWAWWGNDEGSTKELQDGENTMYIFHRQGTNAVFWDVFMWTDNPNYMPTDEDYQNATVAPLGRAFNPSPANGAIYEDTWVSLSWRAGDYAVSHDVYFGENFADVNDGAESTFQGNQPSTYYVVGFPGFPYPDGLVPGTTYYWRIDEINDAEPDSPWRGYVWSFTIPSKTAYEPDPADGAKFIDPNADLRWTAGFGSKLHHVYFGDNFDDVNGAVTGFPQGTTTYTPGTLEYDKLYYWRIDEFDGFGTHKGDVWSFTTTRPGGGVKGSYYKGMDLINLVLTRMDPQIDFNWGTGEPDPLVDANQFSVRWVGQIEAAFTEPYTFYTMSDDGVRLWIDGQQLVDNWTSHSATENKGTIDLMAGQVYSLEMEYYEDVDDAVAELRWKSPRTPKQLIPQGALSPPVKVSGAYPPNGAVDVKQTSILTWKPGEHAVSHQVYFGTDQEAVQNADTGSPEYKGTRDLGSDSYDPGKLDWDTTYYWHVDEVNNVNPDSPWVGSLWSFTTANFLIVDNFEAYNDLAPDDPQSNRIFYAWLDGYDSPTNGSIVGYDNPPFAEQTIVHSGNQSMPLYYDNSVGYSEAELTLTYPRDWTENGVDTLTIWFRGNPAGLLEAPAGTYTMTATGADIWGTADEFRYAWKQLSGAGSISAQVLSVQNTDPWAKCGVMIRETLDPGSEFAAVYIAPGNGCRFQGRLTPGSSATSDTGVETPEQIAITAPYWVKLERDAAGNFNGYYSSDGISWQAMTWNPQRISMPQNVYIGLALTSHNPGVTCTAEFSNVQTTGTVTPMIWAHEAIGTTMATNDAEPMYVALNGSAVVFHDNPNAALIDTWTQWNIDLQAFADQGVNLANVNTIAVGFGDKKNPQPGGSGTAYFDDIRLYRPAP
ncbi:MAG TPA: PA14 domain-containing protein [Sedimentisphaerales bacterium]|nr:PA14 domain-containing protein [Sedimentisphaerales bacterium]